MPRRKPAQILAEARTLWGDDIAFECALSVAKRDAAPGWPEPQWSWFSRAEQRRIAEGLLERAIGRERMQRAA
ncbi:MAG: hypothetical protein ACO1SX_25670 [Actinomycetota bacterium]